MVHRLDIMNSSSHTHDTTFWSQTPNWLQKPLQHSLLLLQALLYVLHAQVPPSQLRLQHTLSFVHTFPVRLQPGGSAAASPMPSDASVLPTRAAPINLSALPREMLPLASPVARASKERSLASGDIGSPFPKGAGLVSPAALYNATTVASIGCPAHHANE
jgi:hypothetical protein